VVTTGVGKFYSNGLDLDFMSANPAEAQANLAEVHSLFARVLTFPAATVAAVQGHAFGAGAMLVLAHDLCVMRSDRGYTPRLSRRSPARTRSSRHRRPQPQPDPLSWPQGGVLGHCSGRSFWATMKVEFYDRYLWCLPAVRFDLVPRSRR
jgi:hypothetical protein